MTSEATFLPIAIADTVSERCREPRPERVEQSLSYGSRMAERVSTSLLDGLGQTFPAMCIAMLSIGALSGGEPVRAISVGIMTTIALSALRVGGRRKLSRDDDDAEPSCRWRDAIESVSLRIQDSESGGLPLTNAELAQARLLLTECARQADRANSRTISLGRSFK